MALWLGSARLGLLVSVIALMSASAAPAFATPTADCSIAGASSAATAAHFDVDPGLDRTPINSVICGPFFGTGSHGMAATVAIPTGCGFSIGWGVFRLRGDVWQLVMKQDNGVLKLEAVGSDIRATQGYPRRGDPRCSPSRTRSQIWHWNGSGFVAGRWRVTQVTTNATTTLANFYSPSRNLTCEMADPGPDGPHVYCQSLKGPHIVKMGIDGRLTTCYGSRCLGNFGENLHWQQLAYGKEITVGRFRCSSMKAGVECIVTSSGKGFLIDKSGIKRVGA